MGKKIVILEDDLDYREVLVKLLEGAGYEVFGGTTGFDIVTKVVEEKPDLILIDLMLPGIPGNKVVDAFQKQDVLSGVPVVILSSKDESEIAEAAKEVNAACWLKKPVDKE